MKRRSRKSKTNSPLASHAYIDLVDIENTTPTVTRYRRNLRSSSTIDLTGDRVEENEPEVIILDDCSDHSSTPRGIINVDLVNISASSVRASRKRMGTEQTGNQKKIRRTFSRSPSMSEKVTTPILRSSTNKNSFFTKKITNSCLEELSHKNKKVNKLAQMLCDSNLSIASLKKTAKSSGKKRKIQAKNENAINNSSKNKTTSDRILKYCVEMNKIVDKFKKTRKISPKKNQLKGKIQNNFKKSMSPSEKKLYSNKKKRPFKISDIYSGTQKTYNISQHTIPQCTPNISQAKSMKKVSPKKLNFSKNKWSPGSQRKNIMNLNEGMKLKKENNTYNPNPVDVVENGLRPIAVDGSNIAVGHGKGSFSTRGVKICVDYFVNQGHTQVKVFLPQHRQSCFRAELLADLRSKCDMVFTPSRLINGRRTSSYDDRFIVQYAVEFGAVIVSTDNYRDLLAENPRWKVAIEQRLLMFTWIDDFLMFPMDPLGKDGPTLDEFLRF